MFAARAILLALACVSLLTTAAAHAQAIWFEDLKAAAPLELQAEEALARHIAARITGKAAPALPEAVAADTHPSIIFVSASDGRQTANVVIGCGQGFLAAADDAIRRLKALGPTDHYRHIKVDLVTDSHPVPRGAMEQPLPSDPTLYGLASPRTSRVALLPEQLRGAGLVDEDRRVRWERLDRYLKANAAVFGQQNAFALSDLPMRMFICHSYYVADDAVHRLYRGHRLFHDAVTPDVLLDAVVAGAGYLARNTNQDGRFLYLYRPSTDTAPDDYNLARHGGCLWALLTVYEKTRSDDLLAAARGALRFALAQVKAAAWAGDGAACVADGDTVQLGAVALAAISIAQYTRVTGDRQHLPLLQRLGKYIQFCQVANGRFARHQVKLDDGRPAGPDVIYYPGEAILALIMIHQVDGVPAWLDTAERGLRYLGANLATMPEDEQTSAAHWLLYSLRGMQKVRPNPIYVDVAVSQARLIIRGQATTSSQIDQVGRYGSRHAGTPAATRAEALVCAYELAHAAGRHDDAAMILRALKLSAGFQLQMQYRPELAMYFKDPARILGGFAESLTGDEIRNDYVQHHVLSLLGLHGILSARPAASAGTSTRPAPASTTRPVEGVDPDLGKILENLVK